MAFMLMAPALSAHNLTMVSSLLTYAFGWWGWLALLGCPSRKWSPRLGKQKNLLNNTNHWRKKIVGSIWPNHSSDECWKTRISTSKMAYITPVFPTYSAIFILFLSNFCSHHIDVVHEVFFHSLYKKISWKRFGRIQPLNYRQRVLDFNRL